MPIVPSRARDIQNLIAQLASTQAAERESAIARLTLLGPRAVEALTALLPAAEAPRLGAIAALEGIRDGRALPALLQLIADPVPEVACRAIEATTAFPGARAVSALSAVLAPRPPRSGARRAAAVAALGRLHAAGVVEALEPLLSRLLDEAEDEGLRIAACDALAPLPRHERDRLLTALRTTRSPALARRLGALDGATLPAASSSGAWEASDPRRLAATLHKQTSAGTLGGTAAIPPLHRLLEQLDAQVDAGADAATIADAKAAVHVALATLGSRIALYHLREMLERPPAHALTALVEAAGLIGDATLLPALAALATTHAAVAPPATRALAGIVAREGLRKNSRLVKRVAPEHRAALEQAWPKS
jgi:HEAT repeat protein